MTSFNRRKFLQAGSIAGIGSLLSAPSFAKQIEEEASSEIGKSKAALDTPALCVDLDKMQKNINHVQTYLKGTGIGVRPHTKTHKCPAAVR
jgi:hypothetical protein